MPQLDNDSTSPSLLKQIADPRNQQAWKRFHARYEPMIRTWFNRHGLQEEDVAELTQEVLLKVVKAIGTFEYDPERGFRHWLRTVVNNALRDFFRNRNLRLAHGDVARGGTTNLQELGQVPGDLTETIVDRLESDTSRMVDDILVEAEKRASIQDWKIWQASREGRCDTDIAATFAKKVGAIHQAKWRVNEVIRELVRQRTQG